MRDQDLGVIEVEDRAFGQHLGGDLLVGLLALGRIALAARLLMGGIDVLPTKRSAMRLTPDFE